MKPLFHSDAFGGSLVNSIQEVLVPLATIDEIKARVGSELGLSPWKTVEQDRINLFADATDDHQFIHVDPELAKSTPFGGTIAHGFLTLSLLTILAAEVLPVPDTVKMAVNYGFDKVRFIAPVKAGQSIRGRFHLDDFTEVRAGQWQMTVRVTLEIEGEEKPALVAEWIARYFV